MWKFIIILVGAGDGDDDDDDGEGEGIEMAANLNFLADNPQFQQLREMVKLQITLLIALQS